MAIVSTISFDKLTRFVFNSHPPWNPLHDDRFFILWFIHLYDKTTPRRRPDDKTSNPFLWQMVQFLFAGWMVFQVSGTLSKSYCSVIKILLTNNDSEPLWQMVQFLFAGWLVFFKFLVPCPNPIVLLLKSD